jgi:metallo-beta-lactamase class B
VNCFLAAILLVGIAIPAHAQNAQAGSDAIEPYRIIGNIYYVGTASISSFLIQTSDGLVLIDTGYERMVPGIRASIEKLGFRIQDVKIMLSSHSHIDHVEGHAAMQKLTGAQIMALGEDAAAIAGGFDNSALGMGKWTPANVDRVLKDGEIVTLGGVNLQAHLTPGHTKGCTTWTTTVQEGGRTYRVVFVGGLSINGGVTLLDNARHPTIADDYARAFRTLKELNADVFLAQHPNIFGMAGKLESLKAKPATNPFIDPEGYRRAVEQAEARYLKQLAEERAARR